MQLKNNTTRIAYNNRWQGCACICHRCCSKKSQAGNSVYRLVAQDVEHAANSLNYHFSSVDAAANKNSLYALKYAEFVVTLVKGEQALSKENDSLKTIVSFLQRQVDKLNVMMINLSSVNSQQSTILTSGLLAQNVLNPFANSTTITYSLPQIYKSAKLIIADKKELH